MKNIIRIVLAIAIVLLAYFIYESIMTPVRFNKEKDYRYSVIVEKLKDIRDIQKFYKNAYKKYTGDYDTLMAFARSGQIPVVKMIPDPTDTTFTRSITDTIGYTSVYDSLFGKREGYDLTDISFNPFNPETKIKLQAGFIDKGGLKVPVFEASVVNKEILKGMSEQLIVNLDAMLESYNKFQGIRVGSMTEVSTDGNWE